MIQVPVVNDDEQAVRSASAILFAEIKRPRRALDFESSSVARSDGGFGEITVGAVPGDDIGERLVERAERDAKLSLALVMIEMAAVVFACEETHRSETDQDRLAGEPGIGLVSGGDGKQESDRNVPRRPP